MQKVILIKTVGGEYYIGEHDETKNGDDIVLNNARNLSVQMTARGPSLAAMPVIPFAIKQPEPLELPKSSVLCSLDESDINKDIVDGYRSEISGIITAKKPDIII